MGKHGVVVVEERVFEFPGLASSAFATFCVPCHTPTCVVKDSLKFLGLSH